MMRADYVSSSSHVKQATVQAVLIVLWGRTCQGVTPFSAPPTSQHVCPPLTCWLIAHYVILPPVSS